MTKGLGMLIGLALALLPAAGAAQQVGASLTVLERPAQPELRSEGRSAAAASIPSGWAYSVSRDEATRGAEVRTQVARSERIEVALPVSPVARPGGRETVTWTFVPL